MAGQARSPLVRRKLKVSQVDGDAEGVLLVDKHAERTGDCSSECGATSGDSDTGSTRKATMCIRPARLPSTKRLFWGHSWAASQLQVLTSAEKV